MKPGSRVLLDGERPAVVVSTSKGVAAILLYGASGPVSFASIARLRAAS